MSSFQWQGLYGGIILTSRHCDECVCVFSCGCSLICVDFSLQADSIYKHGSHVGRLNEKRGLPLNCQGLYTVRSVMCQQNRFGGIDLTEKRVTERREGLGWVRGGGLMEGAFFVLFLSFLFLYPLRHFVTVYSVLKSKKVNILDWLQLSGWVICCMCGFSEI